MRNLASLLALLSTASFVCHVAVAQVPKEPPGKDGKERAIESVDLGTVRVRAANGEGDPATTENTGIYGTEEASVMRGLVLDETPQSVTVITRQLLDDRNLDTLEDAIEQTTGANILQIDAARSNLFFRGFNLDNIQLDGVPISFSSNFAAAPDLFAYDRVEVVRGPAGLFQGAGEPTAAVNLARKRALADPQTIFGINAGSYQNARIEADVTSGLALNGKLRARLLGSYQYRESFLDFVQSRRPMVYGTVEFDPIEDTTVSVGASHQSIDYVPFAGLPAFADGNQADVPRSRFIGASWNSWITDTTDMFAEIDHHRESGLRFKLTGRKVDRSTDALYATPVGAIDPATGNVNLNVVRLDYEQTDESVDGYATIPLTIGSLEHDILVGANYRDFTFEQNVGNGAPVVQNVFDPQYDFPRQEAPIARGFVSTQEQYGVYGRATIRPVDRLTLIGGGRVSWFETEFAFAEGGALLSGSEKRGQLTPYGGIVFDLTNALSLYGSYADIFQPQTQSNFQGNLLDPRVGRQFEGGVRLSLADGRLTAHAAGFRIEDRNRAISDPDNPNFSIAAGEARSTGFETEISGLVADGWNLTAGYSYTDAVVRASLPGQDDRPFRSTRPKHTANLWTRYTFENGLSLGGGARYSSAFTNEVGAVVFRQSDYVLVHGQLGYVLSPNVDLTVTVNNLFDERYYHYVNSAANGNRFGEPRTFLLAINSRW
ncbi:TonB-dependent siderophore receptor [Pacificimonas sp. ICDLI1SI03]